MNPPSYKHVLVWHRKPAVSRYASVGVWRVLFLSFDLESTRKNIVTEQVELGTETIINYNKKKNEYVSAY